MYLSLRVLYVAPRQRLMVCQHMPQATKGVLNTATTPTSHTAWTFSFQTSPVNGGILIPSVWSPWPECSATRLIILKLGGRLRDARGRENRHLASSSGGWKKRVCPDRAWKRVLHTRQIRSLFTICAFQGRHTPLLYTICMASRPRCRVRAGCSDWSAVRRTWLQNWSCTTGTTVHRPCPTYISWWQL